MAKGIVTNLDTLHGSILDRNKSMTKEQKQEIMEDIANLADKVEKLGYATSDILSMQKLNRLLKSLLSAIHFWTKED